MYFSIVESNINKIRILKIFSFSCFLKLIETFEGKMSSKNIFYKFQKFIRIENNCKEHCLDSKTFLKKSDDGVQRIVALFICE